MVIVTEHRSLLLQSVVGRVDFEVALVVGQRSGLWTEQTFLNPDCECIGRVVRESRQLVVAVVEVGETYRPDSAEEEKHTHRRK